MKKKATKLSFNKDANFLYDHMQTYLRGGYPYDNKASKYWDNMERCLLKALCWRLTDTGTENENAQSVYALLTKLSVKQLDDMFASLPVGNPAKESFDAIRSLSNDDIYRVMTGLAARIYLSETEEPEYAAAQSLSKTSPVMLSEYENWTTFTLDVLDELGSDYDYAYVDTVETTDKILKKLRLA